MVWNFDAMVDRIVSQQNAVWEEFTNCIYGAVLEAITVDDFS